MTTIVVLIIASFVVFVLSKWMKGVERGIYRESVIQEVDVAKEPDLQNDLKITTGYTNPSKPNLKKTLTPANYTLKRPFVCNYGDYEDYIFDCARWEAAKIRKTLETRDPGIDRLLEKYKIIVADLPDECSHFATLLLQ